MSIVPTLATLPLFAALTDRELEELARHTRTVSLRPGERLFDEGDPPDAIYVVLRGDVRLSCAGPEDTRVVVGLLGAGGVFGEMGVLDRAPRSAAADSPGGALLLAVDGDVFGTFVDEGHPAAWWILRQVRRDLADRFHAVDARLDAVFEGDADPAPPGGLWGLLRRST